MATFVALELMKTKSHKDRKIINIKYKLVMRAGRIAHKTSERVNREIDMQIPVKANRRFLE